MPVANALKLVLHWSGYGEEGTLSWYFNGNAALHTPAQLQAAASAAVSNWGSVRTPSSKTQLLGLLSTQQKVDKVTLYEYASLPGPTSELGVAAVTGWNGTAQIATPLQSSMVATVLTQTAGASYRGRQYWPAHCVPIAAATATLSPTLVDTCASAASNMGAEAASAIATSLSISTLRWAVYSPKRGIMTQVSTVSVDDKPDTQRRRAKSIKASYTKTVTAQ